MASLTTSKDGLRAVQFVAPNSRLRKTVRLGRVSEDEATETRLLIERLVKLVERNEHLIDKRTAAAIDELPDWLHARLAAVGLIKARERSELGAFLDRYMEIRQDVQPSTKTVWGHTARNLREFFGAHKPLSDVTPGDAEEFLIFLGTKNLSAATIGKRIQFAKQFFRFASKKQLVHDNPFSDLAGGNKSNPERSRFIERQTIETIIAACPDAEWRLIIALSRYGALRIPSESSALRWTDIDWENRTITVHSPKTKRYEGKASRVIPLFPELLEPLKEAWDPSNEFVITRYRGENLRTGFLRIIKRARIKPWPRLFHNLRATRQTELEEDYPTHVVCYWCGNSQQIARKHYLQVTTDHYQQAAGALHNAVHQGAQTGTNGEITENQETKKALENKGFGAICASLANCQVEDKGPERFAENSGISDDPGRRAAKCGAPTSTNLSDDPQLRLIVDVWQSLPQEIRAHIVKLVTNPGNQPQLVAAHFSENG